MTLLLALVWCAAYRLPIHFLCTASGTEALRKCVLTNRKCNLQIAEVTLHALGMANIVGMPITRCSHLPQRGCTCCPCMHVCRRVVDSTGWHHAAVYFSAASDTSDIRTYTLLQATTSRLCFLLQSCSPDWWVHLHSALCRQPLPPKHVCIFPVPLALSLCAIRSTCGPCLSFNLCHGRAKVMCPLLPAEQWFCMTMMGVDASIKRASKNQGNIRCLYADAPEAWCAG